MPIDGYQPLSRCTGWPGSSIGAWATRPVNAPILAEGWADEAELARLYAATLARAERPDAFGAWMYRAAVDRVDGEPPQ